MDPVPGMIACTYATLAVWATLQILPDELLSGGQRAKWLAIAWLVPFVGAIVVVRRVKRYGTVLGPPPGGGGTK
jgi:CelD/BcsL family acetyltransferase involved in cellulose biosynthesis